MLPLILPIIVILNGVKNLNAPTSALQILRFAQDDTMGGGMNSMKGAGTATMGV